MALLVHYLARVLAFTFRGSVRQTDSWQIVAGGTAIPSIVLGGVYGLMGRDVPSISPTEWATFFGYGLVTWLGIRFLVAPFFIWREQYEETAELRLELSKPERMVMEHLTRHRAKARAKLASQLEDFQTYAFAEEFNDACIAATANKMSKIRQLQAQAGLSNAFEKGRGRLLLAVQNEAKAPSHTLPMDRESDRVLKLLQRHLVGDLTAEDLALQLPQGTVPGTQR